MNNINLHNTEINLFSQPMNVENVLGGKYKFLGLNVHW